MGMFDWVVAEIPCVKCGKPLTGFQTKDTPEQWCEKVPLEDVLKIEGAEFYDSCREDEGGCGAWNWYEVKADGTLKDKSREEF